MAEQPFTVIDVLTDAWGSYRRTWSAHLRWNAGFIALAVVSICGVSCVTVPAAGLAGAGSEGSGLVAVIIVYVLMLVVMTGLFAMHQGVTLEIAAAERRGESPHVATCVGEAGARLPSLAGALVLRILLDAVGGAVLLGAPIALMASRGAVLGEGARDPAESALVLVALLVGYAGYLGWLIALRGVVGLAGPCAQLERLGPLAALARSAGLLRGHRLKMIGVRIVWAMVAIGIYLLAYVPAFALVLFAGALGGGEESGGAVVLLVVPYALVLYLVILHLLTLDSLIEGAFHARLTHEPTVDEIASVFS